MRRALYLAIVLALIPIAAHAQDVGGVDQLLARFQAASQSWGPKLQGMAAGTFGILAVIDLVWFVAVRNMLNHGDFLTLKHALVHEIVFIGFFTWLLTTYSTLGPLIIKGFQYAAQQAGGAPMRPNEVFAIGVTIAGRIGDQMSILHPGDAVAMAICGLVVLGCFAFITASMVFVIVESYFVVNAGQILLMFGGTRFTSDIAVSLLRTTAGIGIKLMALQFIAGIGTDLVNGWVAEANNVSFQGILIEVGEAIILAAICLSVPNMFERMIGGAGSGSGSNVIGAAGIVGYGANIAFSRLASMGTAATGIGKAVGAAGSLASAQMAQSTATGGGPSSAAGRAAQLIGSTARNMGSAISEDIGRGLRGTRGNLGQMPWRMATDLNERQRVMEEQGGKPPPPSTP